MIVKNDNDIKFSMILDRFEDVHLVTRVAKNVSDDTFAYLVQKSKSIGRVDIAEFLKGAREEEPEVHGEQ